ncbi:hypothetical protein [Sphingomonas sp.]|jgi:hypothetical protein|uniref:hypothetical protein n=1 Tax=Sphingomonas sp. TaxID=28214 RepID=UPI002E2FE549|nr:hypothetical protein [Sphingomonas sp.]HEX4694901.1 hypothetical protein [Sphingomonas sp.]
MVRLIAACVLVALAAPAAAEVVDTLPAGFTVSRTVTIAAPPAAVALTGVILSN